MSDRPVRRRVRSSKRKGIAWGIMVVLGAVIILGLMWAAFYYGTLQPVFNQLPNQYPGVYDSGVLAFIEGFTLFVPPMMTFGLLYWLWSLSQKGYVTEGV